MLKKIVRHFNDKKIEKWMRNHRIEFSTSQHGFNIHGLLVSEFGYLLRHYTNNRLDSFNDFRAIHAAYPALTILFEGDMPKPHEHLTLGVGIPTAQANLRNLNRITKAIHDYVAYCLAEDRQDRVEQGHRYGR